MAVPDLRPALVGAERVEAPGPYRAFRHFFRHAYGVTLRWEKMEGKVRQAGEVVQRFASAIEQFRALLTALSSAGG